MDRLLRLPGRGRITFEALKRADQALGCAHRNFRSIHVAGTNGKGSVATKIASVLQAHGHKVGLFTSPHIWDFRERIQINGAYIPEAIAKDLLDRVYDPALSFFDCLTLMAFLYFAQEKVDFAVLEAGIGGTFDATNVISPILAVITSVGFDHMAILGNTLEEIAREKGGIAKPGVPLVVGSTAAPFFPHAIPVENRPFYEEENRLIAKRALEAIGIEANKGLEARPPCRFQQVGSLLFDVAHNPQAFMRLSQALEHHFPSQKFPFYLAFSKDKDWRSCVEAIRPIASTIQMVRGTSLRLRTEYPGFEMVTPGEVKEGVVAGSFYLVAEIQSQEGALRRFNHL